MSDWQCPQCGCPVSHYNRNRMRRECDCCGWPVADPAQEEQLRRFDQDVDRAVRHLRAGNWHEAVGLLTPLMAQQPDDIRLYRLTLQAVTEDFENLAPSPLLIVAARNAWDKLERLHGLDARALQYARAVNRGKRERLEARGRTVLRYLLWMGGCLLAAGLFFAGEHDFLGGGAFGAALALGAALYRMNFWTALQRLREPLDETKNPFICPRGKPQGTAWDCAAPCAAPKLDGVLRRVTRALG